MSHQWFVVRKGMEQGPFSGSQLKSFATSGQLNTLDLIRRHDMKSPVQAHEVKGLFPEPPPVLNVPPPLPAGCRPPVVPPDNFFTSADGLPPNSHQTSTPPPLFANQQRGFGNAPVLWNPRVIAAWSVLLFSWAFGAILTAKNWRALNEDGKARRSMLWFYALFPYFLLCVILPASLAQLFREIPLAINLVWMYFEAEPQRKFVNERFGKNYPRKSWGIPLAIATPLIALVIIGLLANSSNDSTVALVKNGYLQSFPGTPIGKAFDNFFSRAKWESGQSSTGQNFVNVEGGMTYQDKSVQAKVQFSVDLTTKQFEVGAFELNGIPQNRLLTMALITKIFKDVQK